MNKIKYISALSVIGLFSLGACSSDSSVDTEKPVIVLNAPVEGANLAVGVDIHLDMIVSDNDALGSYNIDIHGDFDGHSHGDQAASLVKFVVTQNDSSTENEGRTPFAFNKTWNDIFGKRNDNVHHHEIVIPADAKRGEYHFVVKVLDQSGNQTMEVRSINIVDPELADGEHDHAH